MVVDDCSGLGSKFKRRVSGVVTKVSAKFSGDSRRSRSLGELWKVQPTKQQFYQEGLGEVNDKCVIHVICTFSL